MTRRDPAPGPEGLPLAQAFLVESTKTLAAVSHVLALHGCEPPREDSLNFEPFIPALESLGSRLGWKADGVEDLRVIVAVFRARFEAVRQRRAVDSEDLRRGLESARRLRDWLRQVR